MDKNTISKKCRISESEKELANTTLTNSFTDITRYKVKNDELQRSVRILQDKLSTAQNDFYTFRRDKDREIVNLLNQREGNLLEYEITFEDLRSRTMCYFEDLNSTRESLSNLQKEHKDLIELQKQTLEEKRLTKIALDNYRENFLKNNWEKKYQDLTDIKYRNEEEISRLLDKLSEVENQRDDLEATLQDLRFEHKNLIDKLSDIDPSSEVNKRHILEGTGKYRNRNIQIGTTATEDKAIVSFH